MCDEIFDCDSTIARRSRTVCVCVCVRACVRVCAHRARDQATFANPWVTQNLDGSTAQRLPLDKPLWSDEWLLPQPVKDPSIRYILSLPSLHNLCEYNITHSIHTCYTYTCDSPSNHVRICFTLGVIWCESQYGWKVAGCMPHEWCILGQLPQIFHTCEQPMYV